MIALTFDDGPNTPNTQRIVEILKANNAVATFFELGYRMEQNSSKMEMIINNDNQIGNHSFNHKIYTKITTAEMMDQIDSTNALMKQIINSTATVVRPPNGSMNDSVRQNIVLSDDPVECGLKRLGKQKQRCDRESGFE